MGKARRMAVAFEIRQGRVISDETLLKVKSLPRIDYVAYKALIEQGQVNQIRKLKKDRTIFFDEETNNFLYLNPIYLTLSVCGRFNED